MSGTKIAMPQPNSFQSGALSFMSCTSGRESSPLDENDSHQTAEFKTGVFGKSSSSELALERIEMLLLRGGELSLLGSTLRFTDCEGGSSRSLSQTKKKRFHPLRNLRRMFRRKTRRSSISTESYQSAAVDSPEVTPTSLEQRSCSASRLQEENLTQNLFRNSRLNPGLSLSHDSVFTPDRTDSGLSSSDLENSSLSITVLTPPSKECPSSCSESSLLSIESSEVELSPVRAAKTSELDVGTTAYTLSHSAARHKMAVKPRRNHGAPRSRRRALTSKAPLPITLEVSEEGATGRNSPPLALEALESPGLLPKCDEHLQSAKISWSDVAMDSNAKELEERGSVRTEDEVDLREEEVGSQRSESFFGRFLSRRSDKKKKFLQESNPEESGDERGNFVKKFSKSVEGKGMARKTPSRRQRVDPVEIPFTSSLNVYDAEKDKEGSMGKKTSASISPPKSYWPSQVTSRSMSPPKVVWPENSTPCMKPDGPIPTVMDGTKVYVSPTNQSTENVKDWKNANFVKELTVSVSSFAREKSGKREKDEEDEETVLKIRRQHSEDTTPQKPSSSTENVCISRSKSNSLDSVESEKSCAEENGHVVSNAGCVSMRTVNLFPISLESIHDGYENIKIIEQVKQEAMNSLEADPVAGGTKTEPTPEPAKEGSEVSLARTETEKQSQEKDAEVVAKVKPAVSEKPKDLKRAGVAELMKASPTWKEPKTSEQGDTRNEKGTPKAKATLVERRKSELLLLTEAEERELKDRVKPLKKQTSFSEISVERRAADSGEKTSSPQERESSAKKTEAKAEMLEEVVVLRKKSVANTSEEQPELMKVFARRSLKVREGEKMAEDMQRSRDSDKENEVVDPAKEDRKKEKTFERDEKKEGEKMFSKEVERVLAKEKPSEVKTVGVTSPRPEISSRKSALQTYGRSLSENNGKAKEEAEPKRESVVLEENKLNKMRSPMEEILAVRLERGDKEGGEAEGEIETGFKRIQQRKAEWERRAQQGAK